jgi:hypothetical protein
MRKPVKRPSCHRPAQTAGSARPARPLQRLPGLRRSRYQRRIGTTASVWRMTIGTMTWPIAGDLETHSASPGGSQRQSVPIDLLNHSLTPQAALSLSYASWISERTWLDRPGKSRRHFALILDHGLCPGHG